MWSLSTDAQIVLTRSRTVSIRATAFTAAYGAVSDLPVVSGSIGVDSTSQGRRTGTVGIGNAAYWPDDPLDVLSPIGTELFVEYGILLPTGTYEWVPLIRGPITDATRQQPITGNTALTITVADRSQKVAEARFDQPAQTVSGATTVAEIRRLVTEVLPSVTVTDQTGNTRVAPVLDMERERWADGIEKLADSIGAEAFADPAGAFVIRDKKLTRDRTYNRVVASGQRTDGTPPVWAAVSDTNPASPTYIDGPFGIKPRFYASPLLTTTQQCTLAATSLLARYTGMWGSVTITALVNPALDAGDVILVRDDTGRTSAHIVDTLSIPLTPGESQQIGTRSQALAEETES
jgi:hypothetical protein